MKKMIAPLIITALFVIYLVFYFCLIVFLIDDIFVKIMFGIIPALFAGVMIYVCIERLKEIRSKDNDDLSKY